MDIFYVRQFVRRKLSFVYRCGTGSNHVLLCISVVGTVSHALLCIVVVPAVICVLSCMFVYCCGSGSKLCNFLCIFCELL